MRGKTLLWAAAILALFAVWLVTTLVQRAAARAYGPELTSLCQGYASATELPGIKDNGKLVVLQGTGKRVHPWHDNLPDERRADTADQVDYVVCIGDYTTTVEECTYTMGGRVQRIRRGYEVLVVDPDLGTPVAFDRVLGPNPDRCPDSKGPSFLGEKIKGDKPAFTFAEFSSLLTSFSSTD